MQKEEETVCFNSSVLQDQCHKIGYWFIHKLCSTFILFIYSHEKEHHMLLIICKILSRKIFDICILH